MILRRQIEFKYQHKNQSPSAPPFAARHWIWCVDELHAPEPAVRRSARPKTCAWEEILGTRLKNQVFFVVFRCMKNFI